MPEFPRLASRALVMGSLSLGGIHLPASADVLLSDSFTDGGVTNGADPDDGEWLALLGVTLGVDPTGLGSGSALKGTSASSVNQIGVEFDARQLADVGNSIRVSLDYMTTEATNTSYAPAFGFFKSQGTSTSDDAANRLNDVGYYFSAGVNGNDSARIYRETSVEPDSDPDGNGPVAGSDAYPGEGGASDAFGLDLGEDERAHYTLTLTRVLHSVSGSDVPAIHAVVTAENMTQAPGEIRTLEAYFYGPGASEDAIYDTFDTFYFRSRNNDYFLDNVEITFVPEPSSLGSAALGCLLILMRRRSD